MNEIKNLIFSSVMFWIAWIVIPVIMEIIPTIGDFFILLKRKIRKRNYKPLTFYPSVTLIIPVYNSEKTFRKCVESVANSDYPKDKIDILVVNNMTKDDTFRIFCECQKDFPELNMNWMNAKQGKSKALNLALFNSSSKYVLHIDSDGFLEKSSVRNVVTMFENEDDVACITGTILTDYEEIERTKSFGLRFLQKLEFVEYAHAFLAGRNFQTELNSVFTLSGAFSAFRKSAIMKTQLYNTDTVCEDTHVTFQIRDGMKKKVALCSEALFFVDPIESLSKLEVQRRRWQSGELEVFHMFRGGKTRVVRDFVKDFVTRVLIYDHTFAFPRMIWYFALIVLAFINYPLKLVILSTLFMYFLYAIGNALMYVCVGLFLKPFPEIRRYFLGKWYAIIILPFYNFMIFWFRFAGIVNSISGQNSWKGKTVREQWNDFGRIVKSDFSKVQAWLEKVRDRVNEEYE